MILLRRIKFLNVTFSGVTNNRHLVKITNYLLIALNLEICNFVNRMVSLVALY